MQGVVVSYTASASDTVDPSPSLTCSPASGSTFAIGTTTVTCTATNNAGLSASATFTVTVRGAGPQIAALVNKTLAFLDRPALRPALNAALTAAADRLAAGNKQAACATLNVYKAIVRAAPARALSATEKAELVADADRIRAVIGCS